MGAVYRARDTELERDVAVKVLHEEVAQNPDRLERFRREAKAVARLSYPNILEIHDFGHEGAITSAVTELLDGHSLGQALAGRPIPWSTAAEIGAGIADGLAAAHDKGVVHRDIKPSNIFICADGRVKILDFGLASMGGAVDLDAETRSMEKPLTREGRVLGTIGYMSPEQARGKPADHRSDIFSLGCVLYEMVSGARPFDRGSSTDTLVAILKEDPPPLADSAGVGPGVSTTIERCLEKEPARRFQSASDLAHSLRTVSGSSAPAPMAAVLRVRDRWRAAAARSAIAAGAVVAIVAGIAYWAPWRETPESIPELVPNRVAVAPLENRTGDPSLDTLGMIAADAIV